MLHSLYTRLRRLQERFFENKLFRRVVKNSGYLFSTTGVSALFSMLQGILAARLLGVEAFGILGAITAFTSFLNKFVSFRMGELVVKYVGHYSETEDTPRAAAVFKLAALAEMIASLVAFGLVWLLAPLGARYLAKDPSATNLFVIYGSIILANFIAESSMGLLQIYDRFRRVALLQLLQSTVTLALIAATYLMQGSLRGILLAYVAGKMAGAIGLTIAALLEASRNWGRDWWQSPLRLLRNQARELAQFAVSTNISASLSLVTKDSEILWVSLFRNPVETGYYKLALALANMVQMPVSPLPQATYPELSRQSARKEWGNVRHLMRQGSLLAGGYTLAASIFLVVFGRPLIHWLYTPEFLPAYPALLILLVGFLAANTFYWRRIALLALNRADFPAKLNLALASIKMAGIILLVPRYGYLASAALLAGFYLVGSLISVWKIHSLIPQQDE
ncbi:MAG: oligosaccharide flippase family protein [Anaerolineales bacterium]|nr:oligosaccharide flippase family protein [Anaerolineales bacterium]